MSILESSLCPTKCDDKAVMTSSSIEGNHNFMFVSSFIAGVINCMLTSLVLNTLLNFCKCKISIHMQMKMSPSSVTMICSGEFHVFHHSHANNTVSPQSTSLVLNTLSNFCKCKIFVHLQTKMSPLSVTVICGQTSLILNTLSKVSEGLCLDVEDNLGL